MATTKQAVALTPLNQFNPVPGQRMVLLSPGCVSIAQTDTRSHWPELDQYLAHHRGLQPAVCVVAIPPHLDVSTVLALCRAAHEVWVLEGSDCELSQQLLAFRTQSAPPTLNERKSILHAPEVGLVRVWCQQGNTLVEKKFAQPVKPITKDAIAHLLTGR